ncbi:hypothetical protein BV898_20128 [Hypsibius exemplaris]|uniref:Uncharacterized protein n=1 Tax=Hypsibius exemplaris TaxID=2072580 RepID=A0A9X6NK55_HYPEX|nr:hypothetical protein BV898_20128 [Hypsibius exemplaris]
MLIQMSGCSVVCPAPWKATLNSGGHIEVPTEFWRFIGCSLMVPHNFHRNQPLKMHLWMTPIINIVGILNNMGFAFVMLVEGKVGCGLAGLVGSFKFTFHMF